ncbi:MAG: EAL domain-containing protein [Brevundimonas sp.]|uniref:EAL domain-containing protein n=1 Tax=Brevundimonas sp. TaxID=1871086 RepID=UPI001A20FD7E|nr:EAL domain-containing protein [Brevundimonas sp.]MBJ7447879.1 EAL domain-containing protein [Brevundimonas sp.]
MSFQSRLLGLAFAAADVLVEVDGDTKVTLALGAGVTAGADPGRLWSGKRFTDILSATSRQPVAKALHALQSGGRTSELQIVVTGNDGMVRRARFRAFSLPELAPALSCSLTWDGEAFSEAEAPPKEMLTSEGLVDHTRQIMADDPTADMSFSFVEVSGLDRNNAEHSRATAHIQSVLQASSVDGGSAAQLSEKRFAVIRLTGDKTDLAAEIRQAALDEGVELMVRSTEATLAGGTSPGMALRALRMALEDCLKDDGIDAAGSGFSERLKSTMREADAFNTVVETRDFSLHYQPIVDLKSGAVHHFEALSRFRTGGPAATIKMAEEMALIQAFDLAVAEKALAQMQRSGFGLIKVAINVSGASLASDSYIQGLLGLTASKPDLRKRLMVEVTETAALADLEAADRRLKALKKAGIHICLDDFGVGAASFDYLSRLPLDTVKIDGSFVQNVCETERAQKLISHLVDLCTDLKISTVAEMIETEAQATKLRTMGVTYGQGWLFGKATAEPVLRLPSASGPVAARRQGEVVGWG